MSQQLLGKKRDKPDTDDNGVNILNFIILILKRKTMII